MREKNLGHAQIYSWKCAVPITREGARGGGEMEIKMENRT